MNNFGKCSSEEEIKSYLNEVSLNFNIIAHYVDILNYKNKISTFFYTVSSSISSSSYLENNLNFNPGLIGSYDNLITEKSFEQTIYIFHENVQMTSPSFYKYLLFIYIIFNNIMKDIIKNCKMSLQKRRLWKYRTNNSQIYKLCGF